MDKKAKREGFKHGIDDLLMKKCAGVIVEMEAITQDGYRSGMIDLFLEQGWCKLASQSLITSLLPKFKPRCDFMCPSLLLHNLLFLAFKHT